MPLDPGRALMSPRISARVIRLGFGFPLGPISGVRIFSTQIIPPS
jgi:hypothetical protein